MKFLIRLFSVLILLTHAFVGNTQTDVPEYTVRIGNFVKPKPAEFDNLRSMGHVYAIQRSDNHTDVFIGGYASETEAKKVTEKLRTQGYDNAFVSKLNTEAGQSEAVIQLATLSAGDKIDWGRYLQAGQVYTLLNGREIKVLAGGFTDIDNAKQSLPAIQKMGFSDAFVKKVNNALLHEVNEFETGGLSKKPLIPLDLTKEEVAQKETPPDSRPVTYDDTPVILPKNEPQLTAKGAPDAKAAKTAVKEPAFDFKANMPDIRTKVKRTSALELQKVLKEEGTYKSSLDGYYGKGTRAGYELAFNSNRQIQKYKILARYMATPNSDATAGTLQYYINNLWEDPQTAVTGLKSSKAPIAKAYRAYFLYATEGPNSEVNLLMNESINEAFSSDVRASLPAFDPSATYAYQDLGQLLKHMRYVHEASNEGIAAPCWLFRRHPGTALQAFGEINGTQTNLSMQTCGGFWEWEEVRVLNAVASDLCTAGHTSEGKMTEGQSQLARLYLTPKALDWKERKDLKEWNDTVWQNIDAWSTRDPMLAEIATALKITYFQTQVLLEDYFMDEGFEKNDAEGLALAALQALVGPHVERFVG